MIKAADIAGVASSRIAALAAALFVASVLSACSTSGPAVGATGFVEGALAPKNAFTARQPGNDPIETGSIGSPGVFNSVAIRIRNFPVTARWQLVSHEIEACASGICGGNDGLFERIASEAE